MSKNSQATVEEAFDEGYNDQDGAQVGEDFAEDPFAYTQTVFVPKAQFVDQRIQFEVMGVESKSIQSKKFGTKHEHHLTIRYPDRVTGEIRTGIINYSQGNKNGEETNRDRATLTIAAGLAAGRRYPGYYLTGGGSGFTLTKQLPI